MLILTWTRCSLNMKKLKLKKGGHGSNYLAVKCYACPCSYFAPLHVVSNSQGSMWYDLGFKYLINITNNSDDDCQ